jgi:beta-lactamase superfamily II metal-dependent hydrolase
MARRPPRGRTPAPRAAAGLRIRMYNVGFGDCFLLFVPTSNGVRKIVIDCGSIKKKSRELREIAASLIDDCRDPDGKARIDILIASHRHLDHITGFTHPDWAEVEVGEVWMPWVESPDDPRALAIRHAQNRAAVALERAASRLGLQGVVDTALNARSTDDGLKALHAGFALRAEPRFFPAGDGVVEKIESTLLPGIDVFVLGPPNNRQALKDDTAPPGQTLLTGLLAAEDDDDEDKFQPLTRDWIEGNLALEDRLRDEAGFQDAVSRIAAYKLLAAKLDAEINNTSLILIFRIGEDYLLFPGDAQWGPWELALGNRRAIDLLEKVTFIKIGHHASHNASPASLFRDHLGQRNARQNIVHAMISMTPHGSFPNIPHTKLIQELTNRQFPFVNSDKLTGALPPGFTRNGDLWFEFAFD